MSSRSAPAPAIALMLAALLGGCSSSGNPYDPLSSAAMAYVIPGSENWTSGVPCPDGGDCSGPITVSVIEEFDWFRTTDLAVAQDESTAAYVATTLSVEESRSATNAERDTISVRVWGPDVDTVEGVLAEGLEIWAGVDAANRLTAVFVAFGDEGRLAGVGHAAAEYLTIPVARLAAEAKAPSGFAYLDPIMAR